MIQIQGGQIDQGAFQPRLRARFPATYTDQQLQNAWNAIDAQNLAFISTAEFFAAMQSALNLAAAAAAAAAAATRMAYRNALVSTAQIMANTPQQRRFIELNAIPAQFRPAVRTIIGVPGGGVQANTYLRGTHNTNPGTGQPGHGHREYHLTLQQNGRMTRRNEGGRLSFYYSQGGHAYGQYDYVLITDANGFPFLRGGYPAGDQKPLP